MTHPPTAPMTQPFQTDAPVASSLQGIAGAYWEVLKPRVTVLLTFLGAAAATAASGADPSQSGRVLAVTFAIFLGSGGANGLTNYLDRSLDARMRRTQGRAIPSGRIGNPRNALYWSLAWAAAGTALGFYIHPLVGSAGVAGIFASVVFRKTEATHFLGGVASAAPVAAGWLAMDPNAGMTIVMLLIFVAAWVVHHVWVIMLFYKPDYLQAGIQMFPLRSNEARTMPVFFGLAMTLVMLSMATGVAEGARWGFFVIVGAFSVYNVWGTAQLGRNELTHAVRRRRFKTASYSMLCGVFTALVFDAVVSSLASR